MKIFIHLSFLLILLFSCTFSEDENTNTFLETDDFPGTVLTAYNGYAGEHFGESVAIADDGSVIVVGASTKDSNKGAIYVYRKSGTSWDELMITASDWAFDDYFGKNVAISGDGSLIAVINPGKQSIYVYKWSGSLWEENIIQVNVYFANNLCAPNSIKISSNGDSIITSHESGDGNENNSGIVFLYRWSGTLWDKTTIFASNGASGDHFGHSVAISGDGNLVVVGAYGSDAISISDCGSVYTFRWSGSIWEENQIFASNKAAGAFFGVEVYISNDGNNIVTHAPYLNSHQGDIYHYHWSGSSWDDMNITLLDSYGDDWVYKYLKLFSGSGSIIIAGNNYLDTTEKSSIYVYILSGVTWTETKIFASDYNFGSSTDVSSDNVIVVGAPYADAHGAESGAVYVIEY